MLRIVGNASMLCVCWKRMVRTVPYSYAYASAKESTNSSSSSSPSGKPSPDRECATSTGESGGGRSRGRGDRGWRICKDRDGVLGISAWTDAMEGVADAGENGFGNEGDTTDPVIDSSQSKIKFPTSVLLVKKSMK